MRHFFVFFLLSLIPSVVPAQHPGIQSGEITFTFVKKDVSGTVSDFTSTSVIDWDNMENSVIAGQVASETIKTGNFIRDFALRRSAYFDVDNYPVISFTSTKIQLNGERMSVEGNLTLKGISKPLTIVFKNDSDTLIGTATLFTSDFDITILKKSREANEVIITFTLQLD
ncbi:YceI family protein [Maribacter chungangensis]|uniref:YceI family protein n=1 Tax=Maribacter chungangensis TaxID=1069117 RepID=A0ABW3B4B1_9FLAO